MRVQREFTVAMPIDRAWGALDRVQELTSQLPGVQIDQQGPDEFRGTVRFGLGPLQVDYRGTGSITERDIDNHTAVINLDGADEQGQRRAHAKVRLTMHEDTPDRTRLVLDGQVGFGERAAGAADQVLSRVYEQAARGMASRLGAAKFGAARSRVGVVTPPGDASAGGIRLTFSPAGPRKTSADSPSPSETSHDQAQPRLHPPAEGAPRGAPGDPPTAPPVDDLGDQIADLGASARAALSSTPGVGLLGAAAGAVLTWRFARRR